MIHTSILAKSAQATKVKSRRENGCFAAARPDLALTLARTPRRSVDARRGVPRLASRDSRSIWYRYSDDLEPVVQEAEDLSQPLREVWTDGLQAYREMERDHQTVVHKERYVSPEGVHINQAECLISLAQPWLQKFRGLFQALLGTERSHLRRRSVAQRSWWIHRVNH